VQEEEQELLLPLQALLGALQLKEEYQHLLLPLHPPLLPAPLA
jgi:hypothetical protein